MTDPTVSGWAQRVYALPPDRPVLLVEAASDADLSALAAMNISALAVDPREPLPDGPELSALLYRPMLMWPGSPLVVELARRLFEIDATTRPEVRSIHVPVEFEITLAKDPRRMLAVYGETTMLALLDAASTWSPPKADPSRWTADELLRQSFPPVRYAVHELIGADGLTVLGGPFKAGKSLLALAIAQAVAAGVRILGRDVQQGSVLYFDLESGKRRVAERLRQQRARPGLPLVFRFELLPLDGGGLDQLAREIEGEQPSLVFIDTLASAKTAKVEENAAGPMADLMNGLHTLAQKKHVAIVVIHHHGKTGTGDAGRDLRGSSAIGAAADAYAGLYREEAGGATLKIEGRDMGHQEVALRFDPVTCSWQVATDTRAEEREEGDERAVAGLRQLVGGRGDAEQVARGMNCKRPRAVKVLSRLYLQGRVRRHQIGPRVVFELVENPSRPPGDVEHLEHAEQLNGGSVPGVPSVPRSPGPVDGCWPDAKRVDVGDEVQP